MSLVTYRLQDSVATIAMDDGKMNALSPRMLEELHAAFERAAQDRALVVLTGREGVFSAGFDLRTLASRSPEAAGMLRAGFELAARVLSFPRPVVAACNGHAIAMGLFLLLSCDYRIGTAGAYKLTANEVALGMIMPRAAVEICRQRLSPAHFSRAVLLAEVYAPESGLQAGFLDRVVSAAELQPAAAEQATALSKLNMDAHAASKTRARGLTLQAVRAGIEADDAEFRAAT
jgi:enoyl-CoA hydratase